MRDNDNPQSHLEFHEVVKKRIKHYEKATETAAKKRNRIAFTLWRRYAGDYYGNVDSFLDAYVDVPDEGLMKYPIIGPAVRANDANWLATKISGKHEITGASSDPDVTAGVSVVKAIADYFAQRDWNEDLETSQSHYCQLNYTYYVLSGNARTRSAEKFRVAKFKTVKTEGDKPQYMCAACGSSGDASQIVDASAQDNERGAFNYDSAAKCPECGEERAYVDAAKNPEGGEEEVHDGYEEIDGGDNFTKIYPGMCVLVDEEHAKNAQTEDCHWIAIYELVRRYEVEAQSPHVKDDLEHESVKLEAADGKTWLDGLKWWHALETNVSDHEAASRHHARDLREDDLLQRSHWWKQPIMWKGWKSPSDYTHKASNFEIRRGETLDDAFARQGKTFVGLYLRMCGDKIEWIDTEDHRDRITAGLWLNNGSTFHGKPQVELNDFQTAANEWFTMFYQHGLHSSMPHRILDVMMFDRSNFGNVAGGYSYTRKGVARGRPISDYVHDLPPQSLSGDMFNIFEGVIKEGSIEASGVAQASVGQDSAQRTMGGQQLLTQRSLGLMIPSQKSKKRAYIKWLPQQVIFAQKYLSDDRLRQMMNSSDASWNESDIAAFRNLDIRRDVIFDAPEGSDIPVTFTEKEQKLFLVIQSGILWNPEIPPEIKEQVARYAGIDYDPQHYRRNRAYIQKVMKKIEKACDWADTNGKAYIYDVATQRIVCNPMMQQQILTMPGVEIMPRNMDINLSVEMFNQRITALASMEEPDQFKLQVLQKRVDELISQGAINTLDAAGVAGEANARAQGTAGQPGGGGEDPAQKAELEKMKLNAQAEQKGLDREHKEKMADGKAETQKELLKMKQAHDQDQAANTRVPPQAPNFSGGASA